MQLRQYLDPRLAWKGSSEVDKVRLYTRQSFVGICVLIAIAAVTDSIGTNAWIVAAALTVCCAAAVVVLLRLPRIGGTAGGGIRWPLAACVAGALVAAFAGPSQVALWALLIASVPVTAVISLRWSFVLAVVVAAGAFFTGYGPVGAGATFFIVVLMAFTVQISMWQLHIVTELDSSRDAAAALSVAEERLRFSRDLHDVVGRSLSAIAVKSELAAALSRRGDDRAADQMDEVRDLAQQSMTEARQLVRGYRSIDLRAEIEGASSLLTAAGIDTEVIGSPDAVQAEFAEAAAWIVREGATNILRHSDATHCRIEVTAHSVRIVNDKPRIRSSSDGSGIAGLRERLATVGGSVESVRDDDRFTLIATFGNEAG
ncbi:histidine kinase [Rhodococcus sp. CUA-806]|nr:histidine kinase [Rhodococcus sp. CUA-806]